MSGSPPDQAGIRRRADSPRRCRSEWVRQVHPDPHERVQGLEIIDPDAIARSITSGDPLQAGREAVRRRWDALAAGHSHLVETTLAGFGILRHMTAARREGYRIVLHYVSVASPDRALDRIPIGWRSAATISRKPTLGGGSCARTPICRRRWRRRT